jgi:ferredoxin
MAVPTTRTKVQAEIKITADNCNGCGLCISVCKDFGLILKDKKAVVSDKPLFGCVACGHCMAICPTNAIEIHGRMLSPVDLFDLPSRQKTASYEQLLFLMQRRRSLREFKDMPVDKEIINKILDAAQTSPMGLPPSDVNVLVLDSKEKVIAFSRDFCDYLVSLRWIVSGWFLTLMKPFWAKSNDEMFRKFIRPLFNIYIDDMKKGNNFITYDAPLAMYFYGSPYTDPADAVIAATYAMLAAESLGLGTCMIGGIHPFLQNGRKAKRFRDNHRIKYKSREGLFVIFGYPEVKYHKGIRRTFASIDYKN